ncbi:MAG TPA: protein translocase subunit SecF [Gemmatimonadaceae bacterium]
MLRILHDTHIDFIRLRRITTIAILVFILPGIAWIAVDGFRYSIEFTGGTLVQLKFRTPPDIGEVRDVLGGAALSDAEIQTFGSPNELVVRAQAAEAVQAQADGAESVATTITDALEARYGEDGFTVERTEAVGPRVGAELRRNALIAIFISFGATLLYLAWRFAGRLAVSSVLANIHDIIATLAFMKYMNIEISLFVVGGILTVIGYSLADKVVVFDRVRELLRTRQRVPLYDTLNRAVNETLPRTVMTGTTVIACLLALIIFGGEVLRPFALILLFGIVVGTFSSIFVAAPILLWIEQKWPKAAAERGASSRPAAPRERKAPAVSERAAAR